MKPRTLLAIAVAGTFAWSAGANAAESWNGYEVLTPSSVDESAPWRANEPHMPGTPPMVIVAVVEELTIIEPVAVEEIAVIAPAAEVAMIEPADVDVLAVVEPVGLEVAVVEPDLATGASSDTSGFGSVAFDSSPSASDALASTEPQIVVLTPAAEQIVATIGEATPLLSEHYLVPAPLSAHAGAAPIAIMIGPAPEDIALLDSLKRDFYVMTAPYDGEG